MYVVYIYIYMYIYICILCTCTYIYIYTYRYIIYHYVTISISIFWINGDMNGDLPVDSFSDDLWIFPWQSRDLTMAFTQAGPEISSGIPQLHRWISVQSIQTQTGWWLTYPSEKYEIQLGWLFSIYGKIIQSCSSHHQPDKRDALVGRTGFG